MGYPPQIGSGDKMAKTHPTRPIAQHSLSSYRGGAETVGIQPQPYMLGM